MRIKNIEKKILSYDSSYNIISDEILVYEDFIDRNLSIIAGIKDDIRTGVPSYVSRYKEEMQTIDNAVSILKRLKNTDSFYNSVFLFLFTSFHYLTYYFILLK